jgi:hypothetical protein
MPKMSTLRRQTTQTCPSGRGSVSDTDWPARWVTIARRLTEDAPEPRITVRELAASPWRGSSWSQRAPPVVVPQALDTRIMPHPASQTRGVELPTQPHGTNIIVHFQPSCHVSS